MLGNKKSFKDVYLEKIQQQQHKNPKPSDANKKKQPPIDGKQSQLPLGVTTGTTDARVEVGSGKGQKGGKEGERGKGGKDGKEGGERGGGEVMGWEARKEARKVAGREGGGKGFSKGGGKGGGEGAEQTVGEKKEGAAATADASPLHVCVCVCERERERVCVRACVIMCV